MTKTMVCAGLALLAWCGEAKVEFATPFGDGMVLQRERPVPVWGTADAGATVEVRFAGQAKTALAGSNGCWQVTLDPMPASKVGRVLEACAVPNGRDARSPVKSEAKVADVLVGEVWLVSGQSNCELPLVGETPHFSDRQGLLVANMTRQPNIRFAYASTYRWSREERKELRERAVWKPFLPQHLKTGKNFSAMGVYFALDLYAALDVPVGLVGVYWGATRIEPWIPREAFANMPGFEWCRDWRYVADRDWKPLTGKIGMPYANSQPSCLWNDMVAPWAPMSVRGALWYQGCSNSTRSGKDEGDGYRRLMHALYDSWAARFANRDLKFLFVQLAPFDNWWDIQLAQARFAAEEKNAAMVTTCDIGNLSDIHPNEKGTVGKRLAALALNRAYGFADLVADAPTPARCVADGDRVKLDFTHAHGWWLYNANWSLDVAFELAGEDCVWKKARLVNTVNGYTNAVPWKTRGKIDGDGTLVIAAPGVEKPVRVRYLHERPWAGFLYSTDSGLPLGPFEASVLPSADAGLETQVNPFIGTGGDGHCFPAATYPFGNVQAGPDTGWGTWRYCSGYSYEDSHITMFSQTHNAGGGCPDYADIGLMPGVESNAFSHAAETARPGYYAVTLEEGSIRVEVTASEHCAFYRIGYGKKAAAKLLVDLDYGMANPTWAKKTVQPIAVDRSPADGLTGHLLRSGFVKGRHVGFDIRFSKRPVGCEELPPLVREKGVKFRSPRLVYTFDLSDGAPLLVKCALSTVDGEGAGRNLRREIPGWDFDGVLSAAEAKWREQLSRVSLDATTDRDLAAVFATGVYRMFHAPVNIADVDGRYRGGDGKVSVSPNGRYYSEFSLWDTFRGAHPFYTVVASEYVPDFVNSLSLPGEAVGFLPVLPKWGRDSQCMIATHAVSVIVEAYFKGIPGVDWERAYRIIRQTLRERHLARAKENWDLLDAYGYYPCDKLKGEGVSRTLECSYDDWCAGRMAAALGHAEDAAFFLKRAENWRNVFDAKTGFMRGRKTDGSWREPFDPYRCGHESSWAGDFTEGNAWQWRWHVLQDPPALVAALGGKTRAAALLDELFALPSALDKSSTSPDVTGLEGQYVQGNEPSHHIPYLYRYADRPDRTAERVRQLSRKFFRNSPDGLCGNEDHGEMSAWYVFACLGFYPVNPASGEFVLGAPQVPGVTLRVPGGKTFRIVAKGLSEAAKYVKSVSLNGRPVAGATISYRDIVAGGELVFEMTDRAR